MSAVKITILWVLTCASLQSAGLAAIVEESDPSLFGDRNQKSMDMLFPEINATNGFGYLAGEEPPNQELIIKIDQARKDVAANPDVPRHYAELGKLLTEALRLDEAADIYWRSARLEPLNPDPLHHLGFTLLVLGDHKNGLAIYDQLETRYPDSRKYLFNTGAAHYGIQEYDNAASCYERLIKNAHREDPRAFYNLGVTLLAAGQAKDALVWLKKSADTFSDNPFVLAASMRAHTILGNTGELARLQELAEEKVGMLKIKPILDAPILPVFIER